MRHRLAISGGTGRIGSKDLRSQFTDDGGESMRVQYADFDRLTDGGKRTSTIRRVLDQGRNYGGEPSKTGARLEGVT